MGIVGLAFGLVRPNYSEVESIQLQDAEKTLSEKAIEKTMERICGQLNQRLGVTLR